MNPHGGWWAHLWRRLTVWLWPGPAAAEHRANCAVADELERLARAVEGFVPAGHLCRQADRLRELAAARRRRF